MVEMEFFTEELFQAYFNKTFSDIFFPDTLTLRTLFVSSLYYILESCASETGGIILVFSWCARLSTLTH